jgi:osmotically-inducible protein OsmY
LFDDSVDYINEYITVYNNKVYILGIARSEAELNKIIGIAKAEDGVEKVETFVRIESGYVKPKVNNKVNKGE